MNTLSLGAILIIGATLGLPLSAQSADSATIKLEYAPAPVNNPLKGLVPYAGGDKSKWFPHSMEFSYLPLSALVKGEDEYDWSAMENLLNDVGKRGHQAVFRIYLEYPGKTAVIPKYLVDGGLKVHTWLNENTAPFPPKKVETPDYADAKLRQCLQKFIAALGRRYDGDARIGYVTAGLLGTWGEWHCYPREELFAKGNVQVEVMDAYEKAFKKTPVLLRYPAGNDHGQIAENAKRPFGYHDDSFAWATLHTGKKGDEWFYMTELTNARAGDKWKTQPIGGEIRPEAWGQVFDEQPKNKNIQDFAECVRVAHATWLMDTGMFQKSTHSDARRKRGEELVRKMGYEFHVREVVLRPLEDKVEVRITVENRGVAPFYHPWQVEFAALDENGNVVDSVKGRHTPIGILPDNSTEWTHVVTPGDTGKVLALRVVNPLKNGVPLRFANKTQDQHADGWLTLSVISNQ